MEGRPLQILEKTLLNLSVLTQNQEIGEKSEEFPVRGHHDLLRESQLLPNLWVPLPGSSLVENLPVMQETPGFTF